ncbi:MAG: DUF1778 domain-containing protein [bacterium]
MILTTKPDTLKFSRLEARVSSEQKYLFQRAADLSGRTLTDFLIATLQDVSLRIIQEHEMLKLVDKDSQMFIQSLLQPPEPNDFLIRTAKRYQKEVTSK